MDRQEGLARSGKLKTSEEMQALENAERAEVVGKIEQLAVAADAPISRLASSSWSATATATDRGSLRKYFEGAVRLVRITTLKKYASCWEKFVVYLEPKRRAQWRAAVTVSWTTSTSGRISPFIPVKSQSPCGHTASWRRCSA